MWRLFNIFYHILYIINITMSIGKQIVCCHLQRRAKTISSPNTSFHYIIYACTLHTTCIFYVKILFGIDQKQNSLFDCIVRIVFINGQKKNLTGVRGSIDGINVCATISIKEQNNTAAVKAFKTMKLWHVPPQSYCHQYQCSVCVCVCVCSMRSYSEWQ